MKLMLNLMKFICGLILGLVALISCSPGNGELNRFPELQQSSISIKNEFLKPLNAKKQVESYFHKNQKTVLIVLKGGCLSCHEELLEWEKLIKEFQQQQDINFIGIIEEKLSYILEHEIIVDSKFSFPIFHDVEGEFLRINNLKPLIYERVAVLASNQSIVFLGSPILKPKLMNEFKKVLSLD